jgi:hypothetical protein
VDLDGVVGIECMSGLKDVGESWMGGIDADGRSARCASEGIARGSIDEGCLFATLGKYISLRQLPRAHILNILRAMCLGSSLIACPGTLCGEDLLGSGGVPVGVVGRAVAFLRPRKGNRRLLFGVRGSLGRSEGGPPWTSVVSIVFDRMRSEVKGPVIAYIKPGSRKDIAKLTTVRESTVGRT